MELIKSSYKIVVDFKRLKSLRELHEYLLAEFEFFDGYGKNIHALIDCLTSLRYPEEGMLARPVADN